MVFGKRKDKLTNNVKHCSINIASLPSFGRMMFPVERQSNKHKLVIVGYIDVEVM